MLEMLFLLLWGGEFPDSDAHWGDPRVIKALTDRIKKQPKKTYFFSGHFICIGSVEFNQDGEKVVKASEFLNTVLFSNRVKFFRKLPPQDSSLVEKERTTIREYNYVPHPENEIHYRVSHVGISIAHVHRRPLFSSKSRRYYFTIDNPQDYIAEMEKLKEAIEDGNDLRYERLSVKVLENKIKDGSLEKCFVLVDKATGEDHLSYTKYVLFDEFKEGGAFKLKIVKW